MCERPHAALLPRRRDGGHAPPRIRALLAHSSGNSPVIRRLQPMVLPSNPEGTDGIPHPRPARDRRRARADHAAPGQGAGAPHLHAPTCEPAPPERAADRRALGRAPAGHSTQDPAERGLPAAQSARHDLERAGAHLPREALRARAEESARLHHRPDGDGPGEHDQPDDVDGRIAARLRQDSRPQRAGEKSDGRRAQGRAGSRLPLPKPRAPRRGGGGAGEAG